MSNYAFTYSHKSMRGTAYIVGTNSDRAYQSFVRYLGFHPETVNAAKFDERSNTYQPIHTEA